MRPLHADPALRLLQKLSRMSHLANRRLRTACDALGEDGWTAPRPGVLPSLQATLNHVLVIDRFYVDALEGGTLGPAAWADPVPCPRLADLAAAQDAVDLRLIAVVDGLSPTDLARPVRIRRESRIQVERMDDALSHLLQHDTHHRGQAHAMLSHAGVAPPQLDEFLVADDAGARAPDLRALGWTEADLLGPTATPAT